MPKSTSILVVNQNDVATAAGVARSTVSRALKNHSTIPEETRLRVKEVAAQLGYRPDPYVTANMHRVRRGKRCRTKAVLAYLVPCSLSDYTYKISAYKAHHDAAKQRAQDLGFELDVIPLEDKGNRLSGKRCTDILRARGIQGILITPFENPLIRFRLSWEEFAVVTIGFSLVRPSFSQAANDHYHNTSVIIRQLYKLGYRRIGMAIPARADRYAQGVFSAAFCLYRDRWPVANQIERFTPNKLEEWNEANFVKWFLKNRPDAIICINDEVRYWLEKIGVTAPADVGLAHLSWEKNKTDWSGVAQRNDQVGAAAAQLLVDQLMLNDKGVPQYPKSVLISGEWVPGNTVCHQ